jgi:hypothetical protein
MHHSRLAALVIDCNVADIDAAAKFWSAALGKEVKPPTEGYDAYRELAVNEAEPMFLLQKVDHPSRVHLDIETDNMEAEVARLEKLGAKKIAFVKRWWVMESPTGQRFCIVNPQRGPLDGKPNLNTWDGK